MKYNGLEEGFEMNLEVEVVGESQDKATYTFEINAPFSAGVSIGMSTEEVTRLHDHLSFILAHNDRHKEWAAKRFLEGFDVDNPDTIEYVHKPMSKDELAKVKQPKPRYMRHTGEEL